MNLDFLSSIKVKNVCATLLSGTTVCGLTAVYGTKIYENGTCLGLTYLGISACAVDSAKLNNKLPSYYLNTGSTALCATTAGNALALCGCTPVCFLGATATAVCATCAIGAKNLCGCVPASFLLSGGTAVCATCAGNATTVAGCTPSCFLGATATALCATTAGNALCLGGQLPAYYMSATGGLTGATNGIGTTGQKVCLGGALIAGTSITGNYALCLGTVASKLSVLDLHSAGNTTIVAGALLMSSSGATFTDLSSTGTCPSGIKYASDYSLCFCSNSLVNKAYVDSIATGLHVKTAVCATTTGAITLSGNQSIDGFMTSTGNRILVRNQATASQNGIYSANTSTWGRTSDFNGVGTAGEVSNGDLIPVTSGSTLNSSIWVLTTPDPITVGTTALSFSEFSTVIDVQAGAGIAITQVGGAHTVCVLLGSNCGLSTAGTGLCVNSNIAGTDLTYTNGVLAVCASCFLGATACAADSAKFNNVLPAGYLLSGGTAKNALCLGGYLANTYAPLASPNFTTCICAPIVCATSKINVNSPTSTTRDLNVGANGINSYGNIQMAIDCYFFIGPATDVGTRFKLFTNSCHAYFDFYDCLMFRSGPSSSTIIATISSGGTITACNCFAGSGAGLTGTASSLTAGCATTAGNALSLGGSLAACYAPKLSPILGCLVTINECAFYAGPTLGSACGSLILNSCNCLNGLAVGVSSNGNTWFQSQRFDANTATYNIILQMSGGSVGIGTCTPASRLEIVDNSLTNGEHLITKIYPSSRSDASVGIGYYISGGTDTYGIIRSQHSVDLALGAGGTQLYLHQGGNVGIGCSVPTVTLDVAGSIQLASATPILYIKNTTYCAYPMTLGVNTDATTHLIFGNNGCNDIRAGRYAAGGCLDIYVNNCAAQTSPSDGIKAMHFDSSGVVVAFCNFCTCGCFMGNGAGLTAVNASCLGGCTIGTFACCSNPNNFVHSTNEWTIICGNNTALATLWLNYRGNTGGITAYMMGNGCSNSGLACVCACDFIATSDCRIKTCINPICNALSTVLHLQGINYQMCCDEKHENHIGLIAQDVLKVLPEVVTLGVPDDKDTQFGITDGRMGIAYDKITAVLIEAIKEQQVQIKEQEKQLHCLCLELNYMRNSKFE